MEKSQEVKTNFKPYFIHFTKPIHKNFVQSLDGFRNSRLPSILSSLNERKKWLTVVDRLGAPGDAIITANVIRCIKDEFPDLRINCITPHLN